MSKVVDTYVRALLVTELEALVTALEAAQMSSTSRLANRVAELRKLVEARLAATKPRPCLQIIFDEGTSDAEIERLHAEAAAEAGVDPASVEWIHYVIVCPPPRDD